MSSSADPAPETRPIGWDEFEERPVSGSYEESPGCPDDELAAVLRRYRADLDAARSRTDAEVAKAREVAVDLAVLVARLGVLLTEPDVRELRVIQRQMLHMLGDAGFEAQDLDGKPYDEIQDQADVIDWTPMAGSTAEVVARTIEAPVLYRGAVVRLGQVVMGMPVEATEEER
ncbi:hypothetical protein [Streptomyces acidicola]|uniref:hypothetical protein n=1 Tax=Streptomyces acidicola TaxID=2596892 RepID=UPI0034155C0E